MLGRDRRRRQQHQEAVRAAAAFDAPVEVTGETSDGFLALRIGRSTFVYRPDADPAFQLLRRCKNCRSVALERWTILDPRSYAGGRVAVPRSTVCDWCRFEAAALASRSGPPASTGWDRIEADPSALAPYHPAATVGPPVSASAPPPDAPPVPVEVTVPEVAAEARPPDAEEATSLPASSVHPANSEETVAAPPSDEVTPEPEPTTAEDSVDVEEAEPAGTVAEISQEGWQESSEDAGASASADDATRVEPEASDEIPPAPQAVFVEEDAPPSEEPGPAEDAEGGEATAELAPDPDAWEAPPDSDVSTEGAPPDAEPEEPFAEGSDEPSQAPFVPAADHGDPGPVDPEAEDEIAPAATATEAPIEPEPDHDIAVGMAPLAGSDAEDDVPDSSEVTPGPAAEAPFAQGTLWIDGPASSEATEGEAAPGDPAAWEPAVAESPPADADGPADGPEPADGHWQASGGEAGKAWSIVPRLRPPDRSGNGLRFRWDELETVDVTGRDGVGRRATAARAEIEDLLSEVLRHLDWRE
ncbi:MAG TPA: hypothetical protein VM143_09635 [Acidimicrobiales bacterium]|nr:hypothetical protein [Acidimicrobiales bacterium]